MVPLKLVLTTEGSAEAADTLARHLLRRRLVACASLVPCVSLYHWKGELRRDQEVQLQLKTTAEGLAALLAAITELHGYDLPALEVLDVDAADAFGAWVVAESQPASS